MNAKQGRRPRLFTSAAGAPVRLLGSAGKEKGSGARDLRDDDAHGEAGQWELWEVSTSDDMLQAPAMARRRRTSRRRRVCGVVGVGDRPRGPLKQWGNPHLNPCIEIS
jgi:hypothetical protein